MNVSVLGLGKLGSPFAACLAAKGHKVLGADLNPRFVQLINEGKPPVFEPGLEQMLARSGGRLSATTDVTAAVAQTDITFIVVPTPSEPNGAFSLRYVLAAARPIGQALKQKDSFHVVVLTSTVMPGDTGGALRPALEEASGKRCGQDFGLCYSPEFIALGSVIHDMLNPDFILIGESDPKAGAILADLYSGFSDNKAPICRMAFANAELAKLAVNTFVTTKISYANMLAEICERLEGGDVDAVTSAIGRDSRIGPKYLKAALGYGGPCFPRDNQALAALARRLGVTASIAQATDTVNQQQVARLKAIVKAHLPEGGTVGVLGLAYKPKTNVMERSQGFELASALLNEKVSVAVYDPAPLGNLSELLKGDLRVAGSVAECVQDSDVLIVCTPCEEFKAVNDLNLRRPDRKLTVVDCWRMLSRERISRMGQYIALGTADVMKGAPLSVKPAVCILPRAA
jgi:UDPglucose 6-dehydrogenase